MATKTRRAQDLQATDDVPNEVRESIDRLGCLNEGVLSFPGASTSSRQSHLSEGDNVEDAGQSSSPGMSSGLTLPSSLCRALGGYAAISFVSLPITPSFCIAFGG